MFYSCSHRHNDRMNYWGHQNYTCVSSDSKNCGEHWKALSHGLLQSTDKQIQSIDAACRLCIAYTGAGAYGINGRGGRPGIILASLQLLKDV